MVERILLVPRDVAKAKLAEAMEEGEKLKRLRVQKYWDRDATNERVTAWCMSTRALISRLTTDDSLAGDFGSWSNIEFGGRRHGAHPEKALPARLKAQVQAKLHILASIMSMVDILPERVADAPSLRGTETTHRDSTSGKRVFLVHGHDHGTKETVARFIERLGINAVILHEQTSRGNTIIEKLEQHSDVDYAVVLLTSDDVGHAKAAPGDAKPRARQNVIMELGYFVAKLGRNHVCCLLKGDVEIPSDYMGVLYVKIDSEGGWRLKLAQEMKAAGLPVDLNEV